MLSIRLVPSGKILRVPRGVILRDALQEAGILLDYPCAGKGSCRQCRVLVGPALPDDPQMGVRLACRLALEADCTVTIPDERLSRTLLSQGMSGEDIAMPADAARLTRREVRLAEPSLEDQRPDWERLTSGLESLGIRASFDVAPLDRLSLTLRQSGWTVDVLGDSEGLVGVLPHKSAHACGLAVDVGTTTVDMALFDLETGERLARRALLNRQIAFGADVISRAESFHAEGLPVRKAVLETVQEGASEILEETGVHASRIVKTVVVGNPIMIHVLNGLDPHQLTVSPFIPVVSAPIRARPRDFSWGFQESGFVDCLPLISAYVGADTVGMIVSLDLMGERKTTLAIDIGTNGEMVLAREGRLVATSTAAGPAFEGAEISCGMRAVPGAVYGVSILEDGEIVNLTVGGGKPKGICGTGLICGVAQMLERGIIDATGRLADPEDVEVPALKRRLCVREGEKAFALSDDGLVFVSQSDVRKLQLAKGAVRCGIETLLDVCGISPEDLEAVRLAGNFGAGLDVAAAVRIGLIPALDPRRVESVGNAALRGASLCLLSAETAGRARSAARETGFLELGGRAEFQARFADAMAFETV